MPSLYSEKVRRVSGADFRGLLCDQSRRVPLDEGPRELLLRVRDLAPVPLEHAIARVTPAQLLPLGDEAPDPLAQGLDRLDLHLLLFNVELAGKDVENGKAFVKNRRSPSRGQRTTALG